MRASLGCGAAILVILRQPAAIPSKLGVVLGLFNRRAAMRIVRPRMAEPLMRQPASFNSRDGYACWKS